MLAVNMLPVRALLNIGLIQKCQTRRRIVQVAKGKRTSARSLWAAWTVGANSLGGRRQPVYVWHPAPESAQDVTQSPVQRGQSRLTFETLVTRLFRDASACADRRHGIASAHFMCPSKPSDVAMAR